MSEHEITPGQLIKYFISALNGLKKGVTVEKLNKLKKLNEMAQHTRIKEISHPLGVITDKVTGLIAIEHGKLTPAKRLELQHIIDESLKEIQSGLKKIIAARKIRRISAKPPAKTPAKTPPKRRRI